MVGFRRYSRGDVVRDRHLGFEWTVVAIDGGNVRVKRNGLTTSIPIWDVEPVSLETPPAPAGQDRA